MGTEGKWILGGVVGLLGLFGLFVAAGAHEGGLFHAGLALFAVAVLIEFWLIKRSYDAAEQDDDEG